MDKRIAQAEIEDRSERFAVVSDELSYRWQQAEVIEELKADQLKLQVEVDELKAMVNQLQLQVEHLQVAGPAPVQAQIAHVEVHEEC